MSSSLYAASNAIDTTVVVAGALADPVYAGSGLAHNENSLFSNPPTMGRDERHGKSKIGHVDPEMMDPLASVFVNEGTRKIRQFLPDFIDKTAQTGSTVFFGQEVTFQLGRDAMTTTSTICVVFEIPSITSSVATAASNIDGTMHYKWRDWLGLHLMGGRGASKVQWKYSNNNLRLLDIDAQHFRRMAKLKVNSAEREQYEVALGATQLRPADVLKVPFDNTEATDNGRVVVYPRQTITVELDAPWGGDKEFYNQLCSAALPDIVELTFKVPELFDLLEPCMETVKSATAIDEFNAFRTVLGDPAGARYGDWSYAPATAFIVRFDPAARITAPANNALSACYVRSHGFSLEKAERASHVSHIYTNGKLQMQGDYEAQYTSIVATPLPVAGNTLIQHAIKLTNVKLPSTLLIASLRNSASEGPVSSIVVTLGPGVGQTLAAQFIANGAAAMCQVKNRFTQIMPIINSQLFDGNESYTPKISSKYSKSYSFVQRYGFECDIQNYRPCLIPLSMWPLIERHGTGHATMSNFSDPILALEFLYNPVTPRSDPTGVYGCSGSNVSPVEISQTVSVFYDSWGVPMSDDSFAAIAVGNRDRQLGLWFVDVHSSAKNLLRHHMGSLNRQFN